MNTAETRIYLFYCIYVMSYAYQCPYSRCVSIETSYGLRDRGLSPRKGDSFSFRHHVGPLMQWAHWALCSGERGPGLENDSAHSLPNWIF
jgi:hypothetical protein